MTFYQLIRDALENKDEPKKFKGTSLYVIFHGIEGCEKLDLIDSNTSKVVKNFKIVKMKTKKNRFKLAESTDRDILRFIIYGYREIATTKKDLADSNSIGGGGMMIKHFHYYLDYWKLPSSKDYKEWLKTALKVPFAQKTFQGINCSVRIVLKKYKIKKGRQIEILAVFPYVEEVLILKINFQRHDGSTILEVNRKIKEEMEKKGKKSNPNPYSRIEEN